MESILEAADQLVVENRNAGLIWLLRVLAAILAVWAGVATALDRRFVHDEPFLALLASAAMLAMMAVMLDEHSVFTFDRGRGLVRWRRRWAFSRRAGVIPFDEITAVIVERPLADDGIPSRRVVLVTRTGKVPLTLAYAVDPEDARVALVGRIQAFLGRK